MEAHLVTHPERENSKATLIMNNKYIDNKLQEFREKFQDVGMVRDVSTRIDRIEEVDCTNELEQFIKEALEQAEYEGYKRGIKDEIVCVATSGEHFDLRYKLKSERKCTCLCFCNVGVTCSMAGAKPSCIHCQKP